MVPFIVFLLKTLLFSHVLNAMTKHEGFYTSANLDFTFILAWIEVIYMMKVGMLLIWNFT
jgi:hypothetical protein